MSETKREIVHAQTCANCNPNNRTSRKPDGTLLDQGWSFCTVVAEVLYCASMGDHVCRKWEPPHVKTPREKALDKLTHEERVTLGLEDE